MGHKPFSPHQKTINLAALLSVIELEATEV